MRKACEACPVAVHAREGAGGDAVVTGSIARPADSEEMTVLEDHVHDRDAPAFGSAGSGDETSRVAGADAGVAGAPPTRTRAETVLPGVTARELGRLLSGVSSPGDPEGGGEQTAERPEERLARAALCTAIEPGDLDAGRLLDALGPVGLLCAIVEGADADRLLHRMSEVDPPGCWAETLVAVSQPPTVSGAGDEPSGGQAARRIAESLARWRPRLSLGEASRALDRAARLGARLLTPGSPWWPEGFEGLGPGAPLALWVRGETERLGRLRRSVALVGARACTEYGDHVAMESAAGLSDRRFAIVSGGAYGIDAAAHRATLASGGVTVAFLAGGVDRLYPAGNSELLRRIAAQGVLAAELPPGSAPTRWRFLMRNRLIAAAANATIVVEAGRRSGSLNTAGHAAEMGRPLGAVPGSVLSPASAGCHRLIREYAATCVTTTEEMAELADPLGLGPDPEPEPAASAGGMGSGRDAEQQVITALSRIRHGTADEIAARAELPFPVVAAVLGRLELEGRVRDSGRGWTLTGGGSTRGSGSGPTHRADRRDTA